MATGGGAFLALVELEAPMIYVATVRLSARHDKRAEVASALEHLLRRVRRYPGCVECRLLSDADDPDCLTLVSDWRSRTALDAFMASRDFEVIRGMRILLDAAPQTTVDKVAERARVPYGRQAAHEA
jgi:quinol monooxygenase YgiN